MNIGQITQRTSPEKAAEELVLSPKLPFCVRRFPSLLTEGQKKRRRFCDQVREDQKAEFICGEIIVHSHVKKRHNEVSGMLFQLLGLYSEKTTHALWDMRKFSLH